MDLKKGEENLRIFIYFKDRRLIMGTVYIQQMKNNDNGSTDGRKLREKRSGFDRNFYTFFVYILSRAIN